MAIANIADRIEELCQSLEQSLSEFEPLDAHEDSLAVNIDIFRNDVVPAMESLKAVFTNAEDSVVAASSIYLKENVSDLSSIPADIKESLLQVFLLCGSENSITDIASSIVTETLEDCSHTGDFDEISDYVTNMIAELRAGDFGKLFGDGCSSIISEASNILTSHLDGLSDAEKEKIIGSEAGKGFFSYDLKEDGSIDKDSIKAISGMEFHEDGSITDKFGITFTGEVTGHIKEEDSDDAAHVIRDFCLLLNDLYKGEEGFAFLDEFDRNDLFDAVKLVAAGFEVPEHCTEALEKYGKALQRLYNVEILDKEKIADAVDQGMEKDNVDGSKDSADSGFQQAYYDWENGNADRENEGKSGLKTDEGTDSGSQADNDNVKAGSASSHASEKSVESAEAHSHGKSIIWEKTGDKQIDRLIDKRNEYIKNDSLIPTYRYKLGFSYNTMKIVFSAKMKGIEINGKIPTAMDCFLAVNAFTNTNIYESLIIGVFEGVSYLFSSVSDSVKDKVSSDSPDLKKAAAQEAKIEQAKELASEKLESSVVDMAKNISKILEKPEQDRTSKEKQDLIRTSSNYYNAVKDILKLYGSEAGVDKVKVCVGKAFESLFSNAGVTAKGVARLELLLEARSIFKIDGEKITIDFGDLFKKEDPDPDKENMSNDEEKAESDKETENYGDFSSDEPHDTEEEPDDAEQSGDQTEADPGASDEEEPEKDFSTDDSDNTDQKESDDPSQKADKDSADAPESTDSQQDQAEDKAASGLEEESDDKSSANKDSSINDTDQNEGSVGDAEKADADDKTYRDSSSDNKDTDSEPKKKEENQQKKGDQSDKQPKATKDSVKDISLTKEEKALKNQIEKILSGKVTADSVKNNPDIKNTVADIKNAGNKQNISDSVSKVIASIQKDYGSDIDQNKLKTVCKGFESITKINGTAVKIKNVISRAAAFYKQFDTIGIVSPAARMQMELQDKIADYLKSKIPLGTVKNEIRNCFTKTDGITNTDSFLNIVSNAVTNTIIGFGNRISSGEKAVVSRINNVMSSIVSVSKIAREKICSAIEKSGAAIKLSVAPVGTGIVFSSFDSASVEAAAKVADTKMESIANNDKADALMTDSIEGKTSENDRDQAESKISDNVKDSPEDKVSDDEKENPENKVSDNEKENPENKLSDDDRESAGDKASDDGKEDPENKASDDEKEATEDKVSKDEKENPENKLSDDDRESAGDKVSDDVKEDPENKVSDDGKEAPEDKVSKDEKENPENKLSDDGKEAPEDKASDDDREILGDKASDDEKENLEDKVSDDEKEDPENKLSDDGKEAPEDKASSEDREALGDKASDDEKENLEDKVSDDEKEDPENKVSHDEGEDPEDKVSDSARENSESKVSDDEKEDLKGKISDDTEDPKDKVSDNDMGNQEKDISDDDRGDIDNKTFNDGQENGLDGQQDNISDSFMDEQNNQPVDTEDIPSIDHSFEETDTNLTGNDSLNDLLNENDNKEDQSAEDPEEPNSSVEDDKRKDSDIESSLDSASSPHAVIDADDDGDDAEEKVQKQNLSTDEENETHDMEISDPAAGEGTVSELNASDITLQETVSENDIADSDHIIGSDITQEENIDFQNEKIDFKTDNQTENGIEGAVDAILSYTSEPDIGFSDFLDIPLQINGEEMSIEEAYHNEDISNEDLADALADAITADAENILGDANLSEAYGDLLSDLSDMCGNSFTEILCDKMDPMASVDEAVDAAFNSVIEDMSSAFGTIDSQPSFTVMDLAEFEFSIMDSIDNDNIIADGVDAAMQDASQNMVDTGTDEGFDAMQSLQTSSDFSMDNANNMVGQDYATSDLATGNYSMQNDDNVSQSDMSDSYQPDLFQDLQSSQQDQQFTNMNNANDSVTNDSVANNSVTDDFSLSSIDGSMDMGFEF